MLLLSAMTNSLVERTIETLLYVPGIAFDAFENTFGQQSTEFWKNSSIGCLALGAGLSIYALYKYNAGKEADKGNRK